MDAPFLFPLAVEASKAEAAPEGGWIINCVYRPESNKKASQPKKNRNQLEKKLIRCILVE